MDNVFVWNCLEITVIKVLLIDDNDSTKHVAKEKDHDKALQWQTFVSNFLFMLNTH